VLLAVGAGLVWAAAVMVNRIGPFTTLTVEPPRQVRVRRGDKVVPRLAAGVAARRRRLARLRELHRRRRDAALELSGVSPPGWRGQQFERAVALVPLPQLRRRGQG
jgi:hypothetical protein